MDHALGNEHESVVPYRKIEHPDPFAGCAGFEERDIVHRLPVGRYYAIQFGNDILEAMDLIEEFKLQSLVHVDDAVFCELLEYLLVSFHYFPVGQLIVQTLCRF